MAKPAAQDEQRGIEATLSRLALDAQPGEQPEDVAHRAAESIREGVEDDGEGDDFDEGEGGSDGEGDGGAPFPSADRPPPLPHVQVPPPAPRNQRARAKDTPRGKLSKTLLDKMPGAERVMVYKRVDGQRWFIREFAKDDLDGFPTAEAFLVKYVQPKHKDGEYELIGLDAMNRQTPLGTVRLLADPSMTSTPEQGALSLVERVLQEQRDRERERERNHTPPQDPLAMLAGLMSMRKELDADSKEKVAAMEEALKSSENNSVTMMMAMMNQQTQMLMAMLNKPKEEDPVMKLLLAKLLDDGGGRGGALPPPPPPPPSNDLASVLSAMAAFMSTMGGSPPPDDDYKTLLRELLLQKQPAGGVGSLKELVEVVQLLKGGGESEGGGGSKFQSAIDNMAAVMNLAQNMRRETEPGAAAGFFDMMSALFANRDFAGSLAQAIRSKTDTKTGSEEQRLLAIKQRLEMEARILERKRQEVIAMAGGAAPQPVMSSQASSAPSSPPATRETQQTAEKVAARVKAPELPANTYEHVNAILEAKDEGETIGKTIAMVIYFAEFEGWRGYMERLLGSVRDGNKEVGMKFFKNFFDGLSTINMLSADAASGLLVLLDQHFGVMQAQLSDLLLARDRELHGLQQAAEAGANGAAPVSSPGAEAAAT